MDIRAQMKKKVVILYENVLYQHSDIKLCTNDMDRHILIFVINIKERYKLVDTLCV